jgi:hypothetical protein
LLDGSSAHTVAGKAGYRSVSSTEGNLFLDLRQQDVSHSSIADLGGFRGSEGGYIGGQSPKSGSGQKKKGNPKNKKKIEAVTKVQGFGR